MKLTVEQIFALISTAENVVSTGQAAYAEVLAAVEQKGADAAQLAKNRAILAADVEAIDAELKADAEKDAAGQ